MMKRTLMLWIAAALAVAAPAAAGGSVVVDRVVAVVNDDIITMSDLQRELAKGSEIRDERQLLENMIDRKLQMAAAKRHGLDVTERELNEAIADIMKRNNLDKDRFEEALAREGLTLEQYRVELREQMTLSRLFNKYIRASVAVDEAEARAYYDRNGAQFSLPEEIRVRHLVIGLPAQADASRVAAAREKAEALMARIKKGEDFIGLIREHSESPTASRDGDLGFLRRGQAIPEIDEAAKDLRPGEYAGPLRTDAGLQIIRLEEVRTPKQPYSAVKDDITRMLYEQKVESNYRAWLQSLRGDSHIENRL